MDKEKLLNKREESFFDWDSQLDNLKSRLRNDECNCVLISAAFGWGKSSFTNILKNELLEENENHKFREKPWDIHIIETWKYELLNADTLVTHLILDIFDAFFIALIEKYLVNEITLDSKELVRFLKFNDTKAIKITSSFIKAYLSGRFRKKYGLSLEDIEAAVENICKSKFVKKLETLKNSLEANYLFAIDFYNEFLETFLQDLSDITEQNYPKIIFIFRDCDRCSPENLLKIVDSIYHFHQNNQIKFIVESDEDTIKSILCNKYHLGNYFDLIDENNSMNYRKFQILDGYLDKIFDTTRISLNTDNINIGHFTDYLNYKFSTSFTNNSAFEIYMLSQKININYRYIKNQIENILVPRLKQKSLIETIDEIELNSLIILHILNELTNQSIRTVSIPLIYYVDGRLSENRPKFHFRIEVDKKVVTSESFQTGELNLGGHFTIDDLSGFVNNINFLYKAKDLVKVFNYNCDSFSGVDIREIQDVLNSKIKSINEKWLELNS